MGIKTNQIQDVQETKANIFWENCVSELETKVLTVTNRHIHKITDGRTDTVGHENSCAVRKKISTVFVLLVRGSPRVEYRRKVYESQE